MWFDLDIIGPPLLAGLLVCLTHVPLGRRVLDRGIIFIDLAIAQIAALGVLVALLINAQLSTIWVQLIAVVSALVGAAGLQLCERWWPDIQEALIGVTFVLSATAGVLLLAHNPHGAEQIQELLAGQILWVSYSQLIPVALLSIVVLGFIFWEEKLGRWAFYVSFSLAVTASVQLVGVYLVFASLILPALAVRHCHGFNALGFGYLVGALGYIFGLMLSSQLDLPSGPLIVWMLAMVALIIAWGLRWRAACQVNRI